MRLSGYRGDFEMLMFVARVIRHARGVGPLSYL